MPGGSGAGSPRWAYEPYWDDRQVSWNRDTFLSHTATAGRSHTCAMNLKRSGVDIAVIALWLGHESSHTTSDLYLHADMALKEQALARTKPPNTKPGRYRPPDRLMRFLEEL